MDTLLIAGLDSVVGINLAATLSERFNVVGIGLNEPASLDGCHSGFCPVQDENDIREWVESIRPAHLVYCGPSAHSPWQTPAASGPDVAAVEIAGRWATAAREYDAALTVVSTDAVFTGPWIFHDEDSTCLCSSPQARAARRIEKLCAQQCPDALIVRTNVYGWSHNDGWMERLIADLDDATAGPFDFQRHATPILATDFAEILAKAWDAKLHGVYHIAGAERINPNQFARRLADEFGLEAPQPVDGNCVPVRATGFGCGESSLHTTKIRQALDIPTPSIADGLQRLREQSHNGYRESLKTSRRLEKVA